MNHAIIRTSVDANTATWTADARKKTPQKSDGTRLVARLCLWTGRCMHFSTKSSDAVKKAWPISLSHPFCAVWPILLAFVSNSVMFPSTNTICMVWLQCRWVFGTRMKFNEGSARASHIQIAIHFRIIHRTPVLFFLLCGCLVVCFVLRCGPQSVAVAAAVDIIAMVKWLGMSFQCTQTLVSSRWWCAAYSGLHPQSVIKIKRLRTHSEDRISTCRLRELFSTCTKAIYCGVCVCVYLRESGFGYFVCVCIYYVKTGDFERLASNSVCIFLNRLASASPG